MSDVNSGFLVLFYLVKPYLHQFVLNTGVLSTVKVSNLVFGRNDFI